MHLCCPSCSAGKMVHRARQKSLKPLETTRTIGRKPWEVLNLDTAGPYRAGIGGAKYFVIAVCDYTGYVVCIPVKTKKEIPKFLGDRILRIQQLANKKTRALFSDNGREFLNKTMTEFCFKNSIFQQTRSTNFPSENGKAERNIRSIKTISRNLLLTSGLGKRFWKYAVIYAAEILNVLPKKGEKMSPFEKLFGFPPNYSRFKVFGSPGHALGSRTDNLSGYPLVVFLGFSQLNHSYLVWMQHDKKVREFRDITVNEKFILQRELQRFENEFKVTKKKRPISKTLPTPIPENVEFEEENLPPETPRTQPKETTESGMQTIESHSEEGEVEDIEYSSEDGSTERNFCDVHEENILQTDRRGNVVNLASINHFMEYWTSATSFDQEPLYVNLITTHDELKPPRNWRNIEGRSDKKLWVEAYQKEVNSLEEVAGMLVVDYPSGGEEVLELLEIFSWKENTYSGQREAKVRMAGRGDKARIKLSLYSPVGGATGMRLLIHTASTYFEGRLQASDVRTAFLNTRTKEARYFHLPQGHQAKNGISKVWKTFCALYGLAEASFHWYQCLTEYLKEVGLVACNSDECLFMKKNQKKELKLLVLIYVDDLLFTGTEESLKEFCVTLEKKFKIRKTVDVNSYIGVEIQRTDKGFKLYQEKFITEAVEKFELTEAKSVSTPIDLSCLENFESKILEDRRLYQSVIGTLNYITCCTRPDVAFAVNLLARRMQSPTYADLKRAKRVLVYLRDTKTKGIMIDKVDKNKKVQIKTFVDASLGNGSNRKSIFGYVIMLEENILSFKSKKQEIVAQSTCEAEYIALAYGIKETLWIEHILTEVGIGFKVSTVYCDNAGAIKVVHKQIATGRTRHLDLRLQMIKDLVVKGEIKVKYVKSELNVADIFTKPLGRMLFSKIADAIMDKKTLDSKEEC